MTIPNMIKSEKEYQQQKKDKLLQEYSDAILNGEDTVALLISEKLLDINHTLDFLAIQENIALKNYYEFTFDLTNANKEYNQIKEYMTSHGFAWLKDSDYITEKQITQGQMIDVENAIKQQFPWLLQMSTKIYDAIITERFDVRARWIEEESSLKQIETIEPIISKTNGNVQDNSKKTSSTPIIIKGKEYRSIRAVTDDFEIKYTSFMHYIRKHEVSSYEEVVDHFLEHKKLQEKFGKTIIGNPVVVDGKDFVSIKAAAKEYGLNYIRLNRRMNEKHESCEEAVHNMLEWKKQNPNINYSKQNSIENRYSKKEVEMLKKMYFSGMKYKDISKALGRTEESVTSKIKDLDLLKLKRLLREQMSNRNIVNDFI